jgi:hypothetical protein
MEITTPLFREYIRKVKKPQGRLEEITKLSINAAINVQPKIWVLEVLKEEYRRKYPTEERVRDQIQISAERLWEILYAEKDLCDDVIK